MRHSYNFFLERGPQEEEGGWKGLEPKSLFLSQMPLSGYSPTSVGRMGERSLVFGASPSWKKPEDGEPLCLPANSLRPRLP